MKKQLINSDMITLENKLAFLFAVILFLASANSIAEVWSGCLTVDGVSDYQAFNNALTFHTTTDSGNCTSAAHQFKVINEQLGHTSETLKTTLGLLISAQLSGKQIMVFHQNVGPVCTVQIVSLGGYNGTCN